MTTPREIKRGTEVVGMFPDEDDIARVVSAILFEQKDELGRPAGPLDDPPG